MVNLTIGIPTEIKIAEKRVGLIPKVCKELVQVGLSVNIQSGAGVGAGYEDSEYHNVGCKVVADSKDLYSSSELIIKVKEPLEGDLEYLTEKHTLFCYLHLAAEPNLVDRLKEIGLTAIAFETVVDNTGKTPLLAPMSAIAGRLAVQIGTRELHAPQGGRGILLGGIKGVSEGKVTVIGAGVAGTESVALALGMGAKVTLMDINQERLDGLKNQFSKSNPTVIDNLKVVLSNSKNISQELIDTDLLVGAVYVIGKKAPQVVTSEDIQNMPKGSVAVDISIDQGGCIATAKACSHQEPTYMESEVVHSAITNLPAAAPRTASKILSQAILPYVKVLAENQQDADGDIYQKLVSAINIQAGELKITLV